jgi:uncharacterized membrane protein
MFLLSHHYEEDFHRTYRVGRLRICARCVGTYPTVIAGIGFQFWVGAPLHSSWDGLLAIGLLLPALVDWAYGQFRTFAGTNLWRTVSGALLGVALGRTLYVHFQEPLPPWLLAQGALVTAIAVPVILFRLRGRAG